MGRELVSKRVFRLRIEFFVTTRHELVETHTNYHKQNLIDRIQESIEVNAE